MRMRIYSTSHHTQLRGTTWRVTIRN
jgi:hypothetical protein